MSERERWIVYPLLFFALGAAIRDKLFHQVTTVDLGAESIRAHDIVCESLTIVDPVNPTRKLAQLIPQALNRRVGDVVRRYSYGALILTDSEDSELFGVANDQLRMRQIQCESLAVVDPSNPRRKLAELLPVAELREGDKPELYSYGAMILRDSKDSEYFGVANDRLVMRQIQCEGIVVVDPQQPGRIAFRAPVPQAPPEPPEDGGSGDRGGDRDAPEAIPQDSPNDSDVAPSGEEAVE